MRSTDVVCARGSRVKRNRQLRPVAAAPAVIESLEGRKLLTAVSWTGAAGDNLWTTARNWSTDQVPTIDDDVTISIAANPTILLSNSEQTIRSLNTSEKLQLTDAAITLSAGVTLTGGA